MKSRKTKSQLSAIAKKAVATRRRNQRMLAKKRSLAAKKAAKTRKQRATNS